MRKNLTSYQIELLDFVTEEKKKGSTFSIAFNKFASLKKSSAAKVQNDWYNQDSGILRRAYNVEQGTVEKSIPVRSCYTDSRVKYTDEQINIALQLKKKYTYKEVEEMTGIKSGTLKSIVRDNNKKDGITKAVETKTKSKKKGVKVSELIKSIDDMKSIINDNIVTIHEDLAKQITNVNSSLRSEINGVSNILKLIQQQSPQSALTHTSNKYLVDRDSNVQYLGEPKERLFTEDEVNKLIAQIEELESKLDSKETVLEDRRKENRTLSMSNETLKKIENNLSRQLDNKEREIKNMTSERDSLSKQVASIKGENERLTSKVNLLTEENANLKSRTVFQRIFNKPAEECVN